MPHHRTIIKLKRSHIVYSVRYNTKNPIVIIGSFRIYSFRTAVLRAFKMPIRMQPESAQVKFPRQPAHLYM